MSISANSPSKNVNFLFFSSEKTDQDAKNSPGNPYDEINENADDNHISDLRNYFDPWSGIDNDCNNIDDKRKYET